MVVCNAAVSPLIQSFRLLTATALLYIMRMVFAAEAQQRPTGVQCYRARPSLLPRFCSHVQEARFQPQSHEAAAECASITAADATLLLRAGEVAGSSSGRFAPHPKSGES
jgi:hypothetical protein